MRIILLLSYFILNVTIATQAQQYTDKLPIDNSRNTIGVQGGISLPLGDYAGDIGRAQLGFQAGLFFNHRFKASPWGIKLDARFIRHGVNGLDTDSTTSPYVYSFSNGFSSLHQESNAHFQHIGAFLGPSYQIHSNKIRWTTYLQAGALFQTYHEFYQEIRALNPFTSSYEPILRPYASDNASKSPTALAMLAGTEVAYAINPSFYIGLHVDYLRALGDKGKYYVAEHAMIERIKHIEFERDLQSGDVHNNVHTYYQEERIRKGAAIQSLQLGLSLSYTFGQQSAKDKATAGNNAATIEVKDKITGQAIPNVHIELLSADGEKIQGTTNESGVFITPIDKKSYVITGKYNDINTSNEHIQISEIKEKGVHKTLLYDDDRFILAGKTIDCETGKPIGNIETQLQHLGNNKVQFTKSDKDGNFYFRLDQQTDFHIVANHDGKFSQTESVSTKGVNRNNTLYITLALGVCDITEGAVFDIKNILYDFDKSNIRPDAALMLNNVVNMMKKSPNMEIELSSHTDVRGDHNYNLSLSQKRADAAVAYIVSKGIPRHRISAKGYGESMIKNHCKEGVNCTEAEHEQNRRTEIKIIKK